MESHGLIDISVCLNERSWGLVVGIKALGGSDMGQGGLSVKQLLQFGMSYIYVNEGATPLFDNWLITQKACLKNHLSPVLWEVRGHDLEHAYHYSKPQLFEPSTANTQHNLFSTVLVWYRHYWVLKCHLWFPWPCSAGVLWDTVWPVKMINYLLPVTIWAQMTQCTADIDIHLGIL